MAFDIKTLILIIGLTHLMQAIVLGSQYITYAKKTGIGWWFLWSITEIIGFLLLAIRSLNILIIPIIAIQDIIIFLGPIFIYIGIIKFFERKVNSKLIISIILSFSLIHLFFLFGIDSIKYRSLFFDIYLAVIGILTVVELIKNRTPLTKTSINFNILLFSIHSAVFTIRSIFIILDYSVVDIYSLNFLNILQYSDAFMIGLLWTFGFIIMLNQKLYSEVSIAKEHFESIFETIPDAVCITRLSDGKYIDCNEGYQKISGYSKSELNGKTTLDIHLWTNVDDRQKVVDAIRNDGYYENYEFIFRGKNDKMIIGLMSGKLFNLRGEAHLISITRDISDRKVIEKELSETNAFLENLINYANAPIIVWDTNFRITRFNHAFERLTGYKESEVIGEKLTLLFPLANVKNSMDLIRKTISGERWEAVEIEILHKDGPVSTVLWNSATIFNEKNIKPIATIAQGQDITTRKKIEAELHKKNEELIVLNAEKDKFFSIISHDLKSPFNSIVGFSSILVEQAKLKDFDGIERFSEIILQSSKKAMNLLTNLIEWSRSQTGRLKFSPEYFEMVKLIEEVVELIENSAIQKKIKINMLLPTNAPVYADKEMISTVLRNLISNAIKFTNENGEVNIELKKVGTGVTVSVKDNGVGISSEYQNSLFKVGAMKSTKGTMLEEGTGLGLVLCKDFVEKHNGKIWFESNKSGTIFYFTLPQLKFDSELQKLTY